MNDSASNADSPGSTTTGPLSPEHYRELAQAQERAKKIRKAAGVAAFNGWTTGIFAVLSALFVAMSAPFGSFSVTGLLITLGLAAVTWNEFRGRARLLKFDPSAPSLLGWNQLGFLTLIVGYCCWSIFEGLNSTGELTKQLNADPELAKAVGDLGGIEGLTQAIVIAVYGTVIVLSILFQGLNALYYFSRRKVVTAYVQETPPWVLDVQRSTSAR